MVLTLIIGLLIAAAVFVVIYVVAFLIMFIVAAVKVKRGSITQADLDKATKEYRERKARKNRRSAAEFHSLMRFLGYSDYGMKNVGKEN